MVSDITYDAYKIVRIAHTGTKGKKGIDRTDGRYPFRIGRIVSLVPEIVKRGYPLYLSYLFDSDGSVMHDKVLKTSMVKNVTVDGNRVIIETENSMFELEKVNVNEQNKKEIRLYN